MTETTQHRWLTVAEAADHARVSTRTIRRWMLAECPMPVHRPSGPLGDIRIDRDEMDAWLRSRCTTPTPDRRAS